MATNDSRDTDAVEGGPDLAALEARTLQAILWDDLRCRRIWQRRVCRQSAEARIHQAAVARVLAEWLWEVGEISETDTLLPRRLRDPLSRALRGKARLPMLLKQAVVEAFEVDAGPAHLLFNPWEHSNSAA